MGDEGGDAGGVTVEGGEIGTCRGRTGEAGGDASMDVYDVRAGEEAALTWYERCGEVVLRGGLVVVVVGANGGVGGRMGGGEPSRE